MPADTATVQAEPQTRTDGFNVTLNRKWLDKVFQTYPQGTRKADIEEEVRRSLIDHDGYDSDIKVRREAPRRA